MLKSREEFLKEYYENLNNEYLLTEGIIDKVNKGLKGLLVGAAVAGAVAGGAKAEGGKTFDFGVSKQQIEMSSKSKLDSTFKKLIKEITELQSQGVGQNNKSVVDFIAISNGLLQKMHDEIFTNTDKIAERKKEKFATDVIDIYTYCLIINQKEIGMKVATSDRIKLDEVMNNCKTVMKLLVPKDKGREMINSKDIAKNPIIASMLNKGLFESKSSEIINIPVYENYNDENSPIIRYLVYENNQYKGIKKV